MNLSRLLVVAAHPDDEVLGCAGTIAKVKANGGKVSVLVVGEGSSGRFSSEEIVSSPESVQGAIDCRSQRFFEAMEFLNVDHTSISFGICGRFDTQPILDFAKLVEAEIAAFKPDAVMTHSAVDVNNDHRVVNQAVLIATRPLPGSVIKSVFFFEIPSSTEWRFSEVFRPNFFVDISDFLTQRTMAFEFYADTEQRDFPFPRSQEALTALAQYRGSQIGVRAAEAFEVCRMRI